MIYENELLKMKILIYFQQNEPSVCTVGKIASRLGFIKQKISKMIIVLEEEGLVNRSDNRHPQLTKKGTLLADKYAVKMRMITDILLQNGVNLENVEQDAYNIMMGVSQSTIDAIKHKFMINELKKELRGKGTFYGNVISEILYEGVYPISYVVYNRNLEEDDYLAEANNMFERPAYVFIEKGVGKVQLRLKDLGGNDALLEDAVQYVHKKKYLTAKRLGRFLTFPLDDVLFVAMGNDANVQIQGSIFMKICRGLDDAGENEVKNEEKIMFSFRVE